MLLARLLGWIKAHKTTHIFMLEILAVFIGITGSLFVDNWRQQQVDQEKLDSELRALHYEISKYMSNMQVAIDWGNQALESNVLLAFGDTDALTDEELLEHFWRATLVWGDSERDFDLQASNANLSLPYSEALALIEAELEVLSFASHAYRGGLDGNFEQTQDLLDLSGLVNDLGRFNALQDEDLAAEAGSLRSLSRGPGGTGFIADQYNIDIIRQVVADPEVRRRLRQMIPARQWSANAVLNMIQFQRNALAAIDAYAPGITVPFREVGIDGSATEFGWQTYLPMSQDDSDPSVWRTTLDLVAGEVKFRADNAWVVNWGTTEVDTNFECDTTYTDEDDCGNWGFRGDMSKAFPTGSAQLDGINIPVKAGRYDITFNTETLEYSFELVEETD